MLFFDVPQNTCFHWFVHHHLQFVPIEFVLVLGSKRECSVTACSPASPPTRARARAGACGWVPPSFPRSVEEVRLSSGVDWKLDTDSCLQGTVRLRLSCLCRPLPYSGARVGWLLRRFVGVHFPFACCCECGKDGPVRFKDRRAGHDGRWETGTQAHDLVFHG